MHSLPCFFWGTLHRRALIKYFSQKQQTIAGKPWITKGILKSIKIKNKFYNKFCRARNENIKNQVCSQFKNYCNLTTTHSQVKIKILISKPSLKRIKGTH